MSDLVLEDWDIDFHRKTGWFEFAWTDKQCVLVSVTLDMYKDSVLKHFNGRDYEEDIPCCDLLEWEAWDYRYTNGGKEEIGTTDDLWPEDIKEMESVLEEEFQKYLEECANDI